jgi:hypothetical protein
MVTGLMSMNGVNVQENVRVRCGVRQRGVLSPYVFELCLVRVLSMIADTYFFCFSDVSYVAYADDILLISRSKFSLSEMVDNVRNGFLDIGLILNVEKCEYLCFKGNATNSRLNCN